MKVEQGQTVTLNIKAFDTSYSYYQGSKKVDGLRYCFGGGWIDLNGSGDFDKPLPVQRTQAEIDAGKTTTDPEGERLFFVGTLRAATEFIETQGISCTFTVPENATPGQSRLRIVFSDAWFAGMFNPVGYHSKGFTADFSVEILGNNPGRVVVDNRDQGEAEEVEGLGTTSVDEVVASSVSTAEGAEGAINFNNVEKAWVYTVDGKFVQYANNNPSTVAVAPGVYLVKMQNGSVIRSAKVLVK